MALKKKKQTRKHLSIELDLEVLKILSKSDPIVKFRIRSSKMRLNPEIAKRLKDLPPGGKFLVRYPKKKKKESNKKGDK